MRTRMSRERQKSGKGGMDHRRSFLNCPQRCPFNMIVFCSKGTNAARKSFPDINRMTITKQALSRNFSVMPKGILGK